MKIPDTVPEQFDYNLPAERIARYPLPERDSSKLLVYRQGNISESRFSAIGEFLREDDILVVNNTRVIRARLFFFKPSGARIEIFCLEPHDPPDYDRVFKQTGSVVWKCMIGNARKWKEEDLTGSITAGGGTVELRARRLAEERGEALVRFSWDNAGITFGEILDTAGKVPLPPYLNREAEEEDVRTYQTLFARYEGSVAAPTAGLHFSDRLIASLKKKVNLDEITLHVGAGTFKPIQSDTIREHTMHTEHYEVNPGTLKQLLENDIRIIAIGTTSVRTLESLYWLAVKLHSAKDTTPQDMHTGQWEPYSSAPGLTRKEAIETVLDYIQKYPLTSLHATTQLMIVPGYIFRMVDGMVTNFHLPRSSLLMLVAAFIGDDWKKVYDYALQNDFRFLSYGDGSILFP
ncbi:MAG: S-adenosylmethionine:tRNA ribosyltransferase-isomerase [Chlorobi bacterium]|nr:S-adenosylmethionine:tRNA ribosyltransferase-isomerase [Chlorobiota bacterium]